MSGLASLMYLMVEIAKVLIAMVLYGYTIVMFWGVIFPIGTALILLVCGWLGLWKKGSGKD